MSVFNGCPFFAAGWSHNPRGRSGLTRSVSTRQQTYPVSSLQRGQGFQVNSTNPMR